MKIVTTNINNQKKKQKQREKREKRGKSKDVEITGNIISKT